MDTVDQHKLLRFFSGDSLAIATKHGKEKVLQPLLTQVLGVSAFAVPNFDSDQFGTFSGEIPRLSNPLEAARQKCFAACHQTGCRLALASEGSFGAHPVFGFIPADEEVLLLTDLRHHLEFKVVHLSTRTNFAGSAVHTWRDAKAFAENAGFPSHGLIIRRLPDDTTAIRKDITTWDSLKTTFQYFQQHYGSVFMETDMRAMHNPTRMSVIAEAAEKLATLLQRLCPMCSTPGFAVAAQRPGLPCNWCRRPTRGILLETCHCQYCGHKEDRYFPLQKQTEDPQFCDACNP